MNFPLLEKISQPSDLKKLSSGQVNSCVKRSGHFCWIMFPKQVDISPPTSVPVELTVALHRVLETPKDEIVFDVGHQCYTHNC